MEQANTNHETAILAGGCFWGMEELINPIAGVVETKVGYSGGEVPDPGYELVKTGETGHAEAIKVVFNPEELSFESLLNFFFRIHNPTTLNSQGNDFGSQYRSAIFYMNEEQKAVAEAVIAKVNDSKFWDQPVATEVTAAKPFYLAEEYHQNYLKKNPGGYTCHFFREKAS
jgi:methionine-S-sulfoxide reductase